MIADPGLVAGFDLATDVLDLGTLATTIIVRSINGGTGTAFTVGAYTLEVDFSWTQIVNGGAVDNILLTGGRLVVGDNTRDVSADQLANAYTVAISEGVQFLGLGGNDTFIGGSGGDLAYGNWDQDSLVGGLGADSLYGGQGTDYLEGGAGDDLVYGNLAIDNLISGSGNDTVYGGQGDDAIVAGSGADHIFGNRGSDTLSGGIGADSFHFSAGSGTDNDVIGDLFDGLMDDAIVLEGVGAEAVLDIGGSHAAILLSSGDVVTVLNMSRYGVIQALWNGRTGETIQGGTGSETIISGLGDDNIFGNGGNDMVVGGSGADYIETRIGNDTIICGPGADTVLSWNGDDLILGGPGGDFLRGGQDGDTIHGGDGNDRIQTNSYPKVTDSPNMVYGDAGADTIIADGSGRGDLISGGPGDDYISAYNINYAFGDEGDDYFLIYRSGYGDTFAGGSGADTFAFTSIRGKGTVILDFSPSEDVIDFDQAFDSWDSTREIDGLPLLDRASEIKLVNTPDGNLDINIVYESGPAGPEPQTITLLDVSSDQVTDASGNLLPCIWLGVY